MNFNPILRRQGSFTNLILLSTVTMLVALVAQPPQNADALWFLQTLYNQSSSSEQQASLSEDSSLAAQSEVTEKTEAPSSYSQYGSSFLSIAGIRPSNIASVLNTVGDTGFRYFNIQDQCRNRAACDLGHMLYKKLSYIHNWLIRLSVSSLTDMTNVYTQSWMDGMMGRNCSTVYLACRQSPLEGIMNLGLLQQFVH